MTTGATFILITITIMIAFVFLILLITKTKEIIERTRIYEETQRLMIAVKRIIIAENVQRTYKKQGER